MQPDMKRRLTVFGAGVLLGIPLAVGLFQYAMDVQESKPRATNNIEVALTKCALSPGDVFEERCVEPRVIAEQFVPPNAIPVDNIASWTGKQIWVELAEGSAVRTVDFTRPE